METSDKKEKNFLHSITFKILIVVPLIFFLMIPQLMLMNLVSEREYRNADVIQEIYQKWGNEQIINGPVLVIPFKEKESMLEKRPMSLSHPIGIIQALTAHFCPISVK